MNEHTRILAETVDRLFRDLMADGQPRIEKSCKLRSMWDAVDELGIPNLFLSEEHGGFNGSWEEAYAVFSLLGYYAVPIPVGETIIARKLLRDTNYCLINCTIAPDTAQEAGLEKDDTGQHWFTGKICGLPWGRFSQSALIDCRQGDVDYRVLVSTDSAVTTRDDVNEADEPRDFLQFDHAPVRELQQVDGESAALFKHTALLRTCQMAGALQAILELCVQYVQERKQFGRPIGKFQAIQHQLAILAEHCAAVDCAAQSACRAYDKGNAAFEIAAAKLRANRAVAEATSIAHQVHGAIGFTREHTLHYYTQRMWSWRSECGNDRYWSEYLGKMVTNAGHENLWPNMTIRSDARILNT